MVRVFRGSKRLRGDVMAEMRAFKLDALHGGVGRGLGGAQIFAERGWLVSLSSPKGGEGWGEEANDFFSPKPDLELNPSPRPSPRLGGEREQKRALLKGVAASRQSAAI